MQPVIKLYGERNTGTNYLSQLVDLNLCVSQLNGVIAPWLSKIQKRWGRRQSISDLYFSITFPYNLGWKHSAALPPEYLSAFRVVQCGVCFITLTKNPYSWLLSMYRRPYTQAFEKVQSLEDFIERPWKATKRDKIGVVDLDSPVDLWNIKNRSYQHLSKLNTINLKSETLIANPNCIIENICSHFGISNGNKTFTDHPASTKEKGKKSEDYRDYYLNEKWRAELSDEHIKNINRRLDPALMHHFGYAML